MAEFPAFESPVTKTYLPHAAVLTDAARYDALLTLSDVSSTTKTIVRAGADTNASRRIGVAFGASRTEGNVLVTGQRPGEWILLGPAAANQALIDDLDRSGLVSVVDHTPTAGPCSGLTGAAAASALEKLCNLDCYDHMTPDGAVMSASVARVTCDIVRNDLAGTCSYLIACDRSFGQYLFDAILDSGREFGISPLVDPVA